MSSIGAKIVRSIRQEVYGKVISLPLSFHSHTSSGVVVSKMLNDVGILQGTVGFTIKDFIVEIATVYRAGRGSRFTANGTSPCYRLL